VYSRARKRSLSCRPPFHPYRSVAFTSWRKLHKLGIVLKELNETFVWLRMIEGSELLKAELLAEIMHENKELCRIFTSSLKTARSNREAKSKMANGKW